MATTVAFEAHEKQVELFNIARDGRFRIIGYGGAIRGGKTFGCLSLLLTLCRLFPGSRWAIVRVSLPDLRKTTIPAYYKLREAHFSGFAGEINQGDWTATCANGSQLIFFSESLDTDPDLGRWKGLEVNGFLLEEADELAEKSYYKAIERSGAWIMPAGRPQPPPYVFCTFNPCANWPKHVFYEPWKSGTIAPPYAFIPAMPADNPSIPDQVREGWKSLPDQEYRRFVEGDWDVLMGRYYDCLDKRVHIVKRETLPDPIPEWWEQWGSFDWGFAHWGVFGLWAKSPSGAIYLVDSLKRRKIQDEDMAQEIRALAEQHRMTKALSCVLSGHDTFNKVNAHGAQGLSCAHVFEQYRIYCAYADRDPVNGGRATRRALSFKRDPDTGAITQPPAVYVVDTPTNQWAYDQLAVIMPDENDINKPGRIDCDSEGRGGNDGADMIRHGLSTMAPAVIEPAKPVEILASGQDPWAVLDPDNALPTMGFSKDYGSGF